LSMAAGLSARKLQASVPHGGDCETAGGDCGSGAVAASEKEGAQPLLNSATNGQFLYSQLPTEREDTLESVTASSSGRERANALVQALPDKDATWVIDQLLMSRPHLAPSLVNSRKSMPATLSRVDRLDVMQTISAQALGTWQDRHFQSQQGKPPVLKFAKEHYLCGERDTDVEVEVLRIGDLSFVTEVGYETQDRTGVQGHIYLPASGTLRYEPGEIRKSIVVQIQDNDQWDNLLTFCVHLKQETVKGATLSTRDSFVEVHVIDDDAFPTNRFSKEILEGHAQDVPGPKLLIEYFKLQWRNPRIRSASIMWLLIGLFHNLHFIMKLCLNLSLIDNILRRNEFEADDKHRFLIMVSALYVIPFGIQHVFDYKRLAWGITGASRIWMQKSLLRKYFQAPSPMMHEAVLLLGIGRDAEDLVTRGYMSCLSLIESCGEILMLAIFQFVAPYIFGHAVHTSLSAEVLAFPLVAVLVMYKRNQKTVALIWELNTQELEIVDGVREASSNFRLISAFKQQGVFIDRFEREVRDYNVAEVLVKQHLLNNLLVCPWISVILVSSYILVGGWRVVEGEQTLGLFLTTITVVTQMGTAFGQVFKVLVDMQTAVPALLRIINILNMPTPLIEIQKLSRTMSQECASLDRELSRTRSAMEVHIPVVDLLPFRVKDPCFIFEATGNQVVHSKLELHGLLQVQQGTLVSLIGPHAHGKSTLLRVLAGVVIPGNILRTATQNLLIPQHLRVLHVASEPLFFNASLKQNLTFGLPEGDPYGSDERVKAVLQRLGLDGMDEEVNPVQRADKPDHQAWFRSLSETQRVLVCLARALITNAEVLCVEKPAQLFCDSLARDVLALLREHVRERGLEMHHAVDSMGVRPRTIIMTNVNSLANEYADVIFLVKDGVIRELSMEDRPVCGAIDPHFITSRGVKQQGCTPSALGA